MRVLNGFSWLLVALSLPWGAAALWVDGPAARWAAGALSAAFVAGSLFILFRVRPRSRAFLLYAVVFLGLLVWWRSIPPSNERVWQLDVAHPPSAVLEGDLLTIRNVRNFHWHGEDEFQEQWETRTVDLSKLEGIDFYISNWGLPYISHTMVSWRFADSPPIAISIETRKEEGEAYSAFLGFFRQFELYYVVADERDVVRARTNERGERVRLYKLDMPVEQARRILLDYVREINYLAEKPRWYNAGVHNCTTAIRTHISHVTGGARFDFRILANDDIDEMAYERGTLDARLPFAELRALSDITEAAQAADAAPDFSARIRVGLPDPLAPDAPAPEPSASDPVDPATPPAEGAGR
jgi:hypothetical protein